MRRKSCIVLQQKLWLHLLLILMQMTPGAWSVKVYEVNVPSPGIVGKPAKLECLWDSGDKDFYSVRWYKDDEQFYSFILGNTPEKVDHRLHGINVALKYSDQNIVTLSQVTPAAEGNYRCELMSEAPFFQTSFASANLTVVNMPDIPEIYGLKHRYRVGDTINVTCTVQNSRPAAKITFHVNERRVYPDMGRVKELGVAEGPYHGLFTTSSELLLPVASIYTPMLTLTCRAHIHHLHEETALTTLIDPARTTMLSFFNTGVSSYVPLAPTHLLALLALHRLFNGTW